MGFFSTKIVDLGDGNTVTLRMLPYGEVKHLTANGIDNDDLLLACIVRWDGEGFDGAQPSKEALEALPAVIVMRLAQAVTELNQMDAQEKKG